MIQIARIHSRPLDRSKPLWEAYIIEGLDNIPGVAKGSFALYMKFHHAGVDGEAGAEIIRAIHALSPDEDGSEHQPHVMFADHEPPPLELYVRALGNRARQVVDATQLIATLGSRAIHGGADLLISGKALQLGQRLLSQRKAAQATNKSTGKGLATPTRFDTMVSPHRVVDAVGLSLADCKRIRHCLPGVTINDIFLSVSAGAVRRYLDAKGELPRHELHALMPISTRGEVKDMDAGNQIGMVPVGLRSQIADPLARLHAIATGAGKTKAASALLGKDLPGKLIDMLPARVAERALQKGVAARCSLTVSNVRGPDLPLYMAGAQLQLFLPVSIAFDGVGLNVTGFSYNGTLWVCFVACRDMLPDPALFAQCLDESFAELVAAAEAHAAAATSATTAKARHGSKRARPNAAKRRVLATSGAKPRPRDHERRPASADS